MNENVNICITPKGEKPVLHFSQFDNERVFTVTVLADDGESAAVLTGLDIEFRLRKTDSHVVTIAPESVTDNVITFKTTEQLCACCGQNIATVTLMKDDMVISTLDILVDIQRDILSGGLTSASDIHNLETQIEDILDDDLPGKLNELVPHIVDSELGNYYTKSEVDTALSAKADSDDLAEVANTGDYDDLINKPYIPNTYSTTEEQIVGSWIDGKPIYRRVVVWDASIPSASGWQTLLSVPGIEAVINGWVIVDEDVGTRRYGKRDMYLIEASQYYNNIQIYNASPYGVYVKWVVVEYTKLT